jgi:hypothetical protein
MTVDTLTIPLHDEAEDVAREHVRWLRGDKRRREAFLYFFGLAGGRQITDGELVAFIAARWLELQRGETTANERRAERVSPLRPPSPRPSPPARP